MTIPDGHTFTTFVAGSATDEERAEFRRIHKLRLEAMECADCRAMPDQSWKCSYPMIPMKPCPKHVDAGLRP